MKTTLTIWVLLACLLAIKSHSEEMLYFLAEYRDHDVVEVSKPMKLRDCKRLEKKGKFVCVADVKVLVIKEEKSDK